MLAAIAGMKNSRILNSLPAMAAIDDETCRMETARALTVALDAYCREQAESSFAEGYQSAKRGEKAVPRGLRPGHASLLGDVFDEAGYLRIYAAAGRASL